MKRLSILFLLLCLLPTRAEEFIWIEGEDATSSSVTPHPWYDGVKISEFSGGRFLSHYDNSKVGTATYAFASDSGGSFRLWIRGNPVQSRLAFRLNDDDWRPIQTESGKQSINVAGDDKADMRFLAWFDAGEIRIEPGRNEIEFRMDSPTANHGYIDCFVFAKDSFEPKGRLQPDEIEAARLAEADRFAGWFAFDPPKPGFADESVIDLRWLNEERAGQGGFIRAKDGRFVRGADDEPIRFWAVNGPSGHSKEELAHEARLLARYGVNLVRVHGAMFDERGGFKPENVQHAIDVVHAMRREGIYVHFSIYFPLWMRPAPDNPWLQGYDGNSHPFASLFFNEEFQREYRRWWEALLLTRDPDSGERLVDDPAVFGVEMLNEDSYFFWTFNERNIPKPQMEMLQRQFGDWLIEKHGSIASAFDAWGGRKMDSDAPDEGRVGLRPLWNLFNEKTARDQDTAEFLLHSQTKFYEETYAFLRALGFNGMITCSNWTTASAEVLGPLEKLSYTVGDFIDRHGYFGCLHSGDNAAWSIRDGHTYRDRSAYRFDGEKAGDPKLFLHPGMDPHYASKPSMISETTWNRPNRYRSEAPLYFAAFGALQDSDAIVHFAFDGSDWAVKPRFWMQPWTLMSPAMIGQFPSAALIYRNGLISEGDVLARVSLNREELRALEGTPLPQGAALDELRLKDVVGSDDSSSVIDPLIHYAGRVEVDFSDDPSSMSVLDLESSIDREESIVRASNGELALDFDIGCLRLDAAKAQGVSGGLAAAGKVRLTDIAIRSTLDLGHIVLVSLDGAEISASRRMLLQVMSEEMPTGFETEFLEGGSKRIVSIGRDPWRVKNIVGVVTFRSAVRATPLDFNGMPKAGLAPMESTRLELLPDVVYYLIER